MKILHILGFWDIPCIDVLRLGYSLCWWMLNGLRKRGVPVMYRPLLLPLLTKGKPPNKSQSIHGKRKIAESKEGFLRCICPQRCNLAMHYWSDDLWWARVSPGRLRFNGTARTHFSYFRPRGKPSVQKKVTKLYWTTTVGHLCWT